MNILKITSPIPPSVNHYLNYRTVRAGRRMIVQARLAEETLIYNRIFGDLVRDAIREQGWIRPERDVLVYVRMTFYLPKKRMDPNNLMKVPIDVLTKAGVYIDDDIALPIADRVYIDPINPRIEIEIYESDAIGIFENQNELEIFKSHNCNNCKKNVDSCTVLRTMLNNRITTFVTDGKCQKKKS